MEMQAPARTAPLFPGEDNTLPPTWVDGAEVYHTVAQCSRLQEIRRHRRVTGKPGVKLRLCWNCEDILRAKRSG